MRTRILIIMLLFLACKSKNDSKFNQDNKICKCLSHCGSDSSFEVCKTFNSRGKLIYIEEIQGSSKKGFPTNYEGPDSIIKVMAGFYLYKEYFNNSIVFPRQGVNRKIDDLTADSVKSFSPVIKKEIRSKIGIDLSEAEIQNLIIYCLHN